VPINPKTTLALTALSFTPCHPHLASVSFLSPFRLFLSAGAQVKNKNRPATAGFRFWLKDEEDPDPAKAEQYKRWRDLKTLQVENEKKSTKSHTAAN
jgi:hypothetical protein